MELRATQSDSDARRRLIDQLVDQSLAQQDQWEKEKQELISNLSADKNLLSQDDSLLDAGTSLADRLDTNQSPTIVKYSDQADLKNENMRGKIDHSNQIHYLESSLEASNKQCSVLLVELEQCKVNLAAATEQNEYFARIHESMNSLSGQALAIKAQTEYAVNELYSVRIERDALQSKVVDFNTEISDINSDVSSLNDMLESARLRISELESDKRAMSRHLEIKLEEYSADRQVLLEDVRQLTATGALLRDTVAKHEAEIELLTDSNVAMMHDHNAELKRTAAQTVLAEGDALLQLHDLKSEHSSSLLELEELHSSLQSSKELLAEEIEKNKELQASVEELEEIKSFLESDNDSARLTLIDKVLRYCML